MDYDNKELLKKSISEFVVCLSKYSSRRITNAKNLNDLLNYNGFFSIDDNIRREINIKSNYETAITSSITELKKIQSKAEITSNLLLNAYESMNIALISLELIITDFEEINELRSKFLDQYIQLSSEMYGTKELDNKKEIIENNMSTTLSKVLADIKENDDVISKVNNYINRVFVLEFSNYWINNICKNISDDDLDAIIKHALSANQKSSQQKTQNPKNDLLLLFYQKYQKFNRTDDSFSFIQSRGDIQFWFGVFLQTKKTLNSEIHYEGVLDLTFNKLNFFRNICTHIGAASVSSIWLIYTLSTIVSFLDSIGNKDTSWKIDARIIEKRLIFERFRLFGHKSEKRVPLYSDNDYSFFNVPTSETITNWSGILTPQFLSEGELPSAILSGECNLHERASQIANLFFPDRNENNDCKKNISLLEKFFSENAVIFNSYVIGEKAIKLIKESYPFHPSFFVFTKTLETETVYRLAKRAILNSINNSQETALIMPYSMLPGQTINENTKLDEALLEKFSNPDLIEEEDTTEGWSFFHDLEIYEDGFVQKNVSNKMGTRIAKTIALFNILDIDNFKPYRDNLRYCVLSPGESNSVFEDILDKIMETSPMLEYSKGQYRYLVPENFESQMKLINCILEENSDSYSQIIEKILQELEKNNPNCNVLLYSYSFYNSAGKRSELRKDCKNIILLQPHHSYVPPESKKLENMLSPDDKIYSVIFSDGTFSYFERVLPVRCLWRKAVICSLLKKSSLENSEYLEEIRNYINRTIWQDFSVEKIVREENRPIMVI